MRKQEVEPANTATVIARFPGEREQAWRHDCFTIGGARRLAEMWTRLHPFYEYEAKLLETGRGK